MQSKAIEVNFQNKRHFQNYICLITPSYDSIVTPPNSIVSTYDCQSIILVSNFTEKEQTIYPGESVGIYEVIDNVNDIVDIDLPIDNQIKPDVRVVDDEEVRLG